jgi:hypothetical protein
MQYSLQQKIGRKFKYEFFAVFSLLCVGLCLFWQGRVIEGVKSNKQDFISTCLIIYRSSPIIRPYI